MNDGYLRCDAVNAGDSHLPLVERWRTEWILLTFPLD